MAVGRVVFFYHSKLSSPIGQRASHPRLKRLLSTVHTMALLDRRHKLARLLPVIGGAATGTRVQPECVVLGVREGVSPSPKPPVRIFLGTEPDQYRAERVFFWSIEQVRDPGRIYEIHLMVQAARQNSNLKLTRASVEHAQTLRRTVLRLGESRNPAVNSR